MRKFFYYLFKVLTFPFCFIGFLILSLFFGLIAIFVFLMENLSNVMESNFVMFYNWLNKIFKFDKE